MGSRSPHRKDKEVEEARWERRRFDSSDSLRTYYCAHCASLCLISRQNLWKCPQRNTDGAWILSRNISDKEEEACWNLVLNQGEKVLVTRTSAKFDKGSTSANLVEIQYRYSCKDCGLLIAYQSEPFSERLDHSANTIFVLNDSLVEDVSEVFRRYRHMTKNRA